jgi:putative ABC transport system ATP-binding protein
MIDLRHVSRHYATGRGTLAALREVTLRVATGEWVALVGRSGSGKSTLLNLIAGLDRPSAGSVVVAGTDLGELSEEALARWRARHVGIVFQFFQLLPTLTALENVVLPMAFAGRATHRGDHLTRGRALLARVGVAHLHDQLPGELSGGEQQRVAVARALANRPPLLLADEPTGNLDAASGAAVLDLLIDYWREGGTLVVVTHDPAIAAPSDHPAPRIVGLEDGALVTESARAIAADD